MGYEWGHQKSTRARLQTRPRQAFLPQHIMCSGRKQRISSTSHNIAVRGMVLCRAGSKEAILVKRTNFCAGSNGGQGGTGAIMNAEGTGHAGQRTPYLVSIALFPPGLNVDLAPYGGVTMR